MIRSMAILIATIAASVLMAGVLFFRCLGVFIPAFQTGNMGVGVVGIASPLLHHPRVRLG